MTMRNRVFSGGTRLRGEKEYLRGCVHTVFEPSGELVIPLSQRFGVTVNPLVSVGDAVFVGTKLSECADAPALAAHSPCSGTVKAIERRLTARGTAECIVLENDRKYRSADGVGGAVEWQELSRSEILRRIREGAASGVCSVRFPTAGKLDSLKPEDVSRVVVDASEWEPIVSSDDDILRTCGFGVITGLRILLRLFPGAEGVILLGDDKANAAATIRRALRGSAGIRVVSVPAGRPMGDEATIRRTLSGAAAEDDASVCLVETPAEANAVCDAVCRSTPFFRRIVTVAGSAVNNPGNYLVRIGTSCAELVAAAGGLRKGARLDRAVLGGPLSGIGLNTLDVPIQKDSSALLLFAAETESEPSSECFRCGRCAEVCPVGLLPMQMLRAVKGGDMTRYEKRLHGLECVSCGACTWACPARQPLGETFTYAETLLRGAAKK